MEGTPIRKKELSIETTSGLIDQMTNTENQEELLQLFGQAAGNPFYQEILSRISTLEAIAAEYERHQHSRSGKILIRKQ